MLVVIANNLPMAVRGRMKLWFIEIKPNIFVSGLKDSAAKEVVDYLYRFGTFKTGILILRSHSKPPGYILNWLGEPSRRPTNLSGLQLIIEKFVISKEV